MKSNKNRKGRLTLMPIYSFNVEFEVINDFVAAIVIILRRYQSIYTSHVYAPGEKPVATA